MCHCVNVTVSRCPLLSVSLSDSQDASVDVKASGTNSAARWSVESAGSSGSIVSITSTNQSPTAVAKLSIEASPSSGTTSGNAGTHSEHTRCTLGAHSVHTQSTLSAHSVHTRCTLSAHSEHTRCTLGAHSVHTQPMLHLRFLYTLYSQFRHTLRELSRETTDSVSQALSAHRSLRLPQTWCMQSCCSSPSTKTLYSTQLQLDRQAVRRSKLKAKDLKAVCCRCCLTVCVYHCV